MRNSAAVSGIPASKFDLGDLLETTSGQDVMVQGSRQVRLVVLGGGWVPAGASAQGEVK